MFKLTLSLKWLDFINMVGVYVVNLGFYKTSSEHGDMGVANADNSLVKFVIFVSVTTGSIKI